MYQVEFTPVPSSNRFPKSRCDLYDIWADGTRVHAGPSFTLQLMDSRVAFSGRGSLAHRYSEPVEAITDSSEDAWDRIRRMFLPDVENTPGDADAFADEVRSLVAKAD